MTDQRSGRFATTAPIVILPRTEAGRELLRLVLPFAHDPDRPDGEFPDGSSLYNTDYDALAVECERDVKEYEEWCRECDRDNETYEAWCREREQGQ